MSGKASKAEVMQRVEAIFELRLGGAEYHDIAKYADATKDFDGNPKEPWRVKETQLREYIRRADALCQRRLDSRADHLLTRHILQRRRLYAHALEVGDLRTALAILKDEADLERLYETYDKPEGPLDGGQAGGAASMTTGDVVKVVAGRLRQIDQSDLPTAEKSRLTAALADTLLRAIGVDVIDKRLEALQAVLIGRKDKGK
jgi:hypothetical protein